MLRARIRNLSMTHEKGGGREDPAWRKTRKRKKKGKKKKEKKKEKNLYHAAGKDRLGENNEKSHAQ